MNTALSEPPTHQTESVVYVCGGAFENEGSEGAAPPHHPHCPRSPQERRTQGEWWRDEKQQLQECPQLDLMGESWSCHQRRRRAGADLVERQQDLCHLGVTPPLVSSSGLAPGPKYCSVGPGRL